MRKIIFCVGTTTDSYQGAKFLSRGIGPYDIAMLKTEMPFEYTNAVKPIALPPENTDLSKGSLMLSGWGVLRTTVFIPVMPTQLQELNVTYLPYESKYLLYIKQLFQNLNKILSYELIT